MASGGPSKRHGKTAFGAAREFFALHRQRFIFGAALGMAALLVPAVHAFASGTLRISGTGGAIGTARILADAFRKARPAARVAVVPSMGSDGAINAVLAKRLDIALSSRPLTEEERARGAVETVYAKTPFAFGVNMETQTTGLTLAEAAEIYSGRKIRWDDRRRIRLVLRPKGESDLTILKSMSPQMSAAVDSALLLEGQIVALTDQEAAETIEKVPGAFGAVTLAAVVSEKRAIRLLALEGIEPDLRNLAGGAYRYSKTFRMVTRKHPSAPVRRFIEFVHSPLGIGILEKNGQLAVR